MEGRTRAALHVLEGSGRHSQRIETEISVPAAAFKGGLQQDLYKQLYNCLQLFIKIHKSCILCKFKQLEEQHMKAIPQIALETICPV